jgi:fructokinase
MSARVDSADADAPNLRIGIDLGGTKVEAIALAGDAEVVPRRRVPAPREYEGTLRAITELVREVERLAGREGTVGIGIPGALTAEAGLVKNANSTWLNGQPLQRDLEARLGRPLRLTNDANCFAVSEATDGAGAGSNVVFGVILGTGVGAGIVAGGRVVEGPNRIAGEWGHNPLPWMTAAEFPGSECYCGKVGCIEAMLSGPAFEKAFATKTGSRATSAEIVRHAAAGERPAAEALRWYHDALARALSSVINVLDPDVIVLGGGMSNLPSLETETARLLPRYVFSDTVVTPIRKNRHGDSSGVRGAAWLWP